MGIRWKCDEQKCEWRSEGGGASRGEAGVTVVIIVGCAVVICAVVLRVTIGCMNHAMVRRRRRDKKRAEAMVEGMTGTQVEELVDKDGIGNGECAICLSELEQGERIVVLRETCSHVFHDICLRQWFSSSKPSCPTCRTSCVFPLPINATTHL